MRMTVSLSLMGEGQPEVKRGAAHAEPPSLHLEDGRSVLLTPKGLRCLQAGRAIWAKIGPDTYEIRWLGGKHGK